MVNASRKYKKIVQLGTQTRSCEYMRKCIDYIKSGAMPFSVLWNPADLGYLTVWVADYLVDGGTIEGDLDVLLDVVKRLHGVPFDKGVMRVLTTVIIDDRRDKELTMDGKIASVEDKPG